MWQLKMRTPNRAMDRVRHIRGVGPGARRILELEGDPSGPSLFFRVYADR